MLIDLIGKRNSTYKRLLSRAESDNLLSSRLPWILIGTLVWAGIIALRLFWLQVVNYNYYHKRAKCQHTVKIPIDPIRGEISDCNGKFLAISLKVESLFCTPTTFYSKQESLSSSNDVNLDKRFSNPEYYKANIVAEKLAPIIDMPKHIILERLLRKKTFVWIKRQLSAEKVFAIKQLGLEGIGFLPESKRQYPSGTLACQLVGFTSLDGIGQLGIERAFNAQLSGIGGEIIATRDAKGNLLISQENFSKIPINGSNVQLTIDATIQHIVEEALEEGIKRSHPNTAYAVVVNPFSGEILAMAGTPTFDPNIAMSNKLLSRSESELSPLEKTEYRQEQERQRAARKVHPVEDSYEPGSTMKVITIAIALEEHKTHRGELINCEGGRWKYCDAVITDTHRNGTITLEQVLWVSSNVGTAKVGLRLNSDIHHQYLCKFGFGEPTGLNFPGETGGRLPPCSIWSATTQLTMSYGYGLSVSPIQILMAGSVLANGGNLMQPYIVKKIFNDKGNIIQEFKPNIRRRVISEETAGIMRKMLVGVIENGTGKLAKLDGNIDAFGKTGTARKIINKKYDPSRHYASFMGFFPVDKPQYGILVMLDDPKNNATGGDVAAPIFKKICDSIVAYKNSHYNYDPESKLSLALKDWPINSHNYDSFHVEAGKVPDLKGLNVKSAVRRIILAGGVPKLEGLNDTGPYVIKVIDQYPVAGTAIQPSTIIKIKLGK